MHQGPLVRRFPWPLLVWVVVAVGGLGWSAVGGAAAPAMASSAAAACDATVVDETGQLDQSQVEQAASAFGDQATVRVRFFQSVSGGDLDATLEELITQCWPGPGRIQGDLLLLAVSLGDRQAALRWGNGLEPALGEGVGGRIRTDVVSPRLASGDFTGAMVAGLDAARSELQEQPVAGADPGAGVGVGSDDDDGGTPLVPAGVVVGALALGGGAVAVNRRRQLQQRRRRLDEAMIEPLSRAGDLRERNRQLQLRAGTVEHVVTGASSARLDQWRAAARNAGQQVDGALQLVRQALPEGVGQASTDQLERGEQRVAELLVAVEAHDRALSDLDRGLRRLEELAVTLPAKQELLDEEIDDTRQLVAQRAAEGWRTEDLVAQLELSDAELDGIDLSPLRLDLVALSDRIERIEAEVFATRHALQTLPERRSGLEEWAAQLRQSVQLERERIGAAAAELQRLAAIHDPASLAHLVDNPERARVELDRCESGVAAAMGTPFAAQDWDEVGRGLEQAGMHLVAADAQLDEVDQASVELNDAQARSAQVLRQAQQVLAHVEQFVAQHDEDLGPRFDTEPAAVRSLLGGLEAELRRPRPNHLRVLRTSEEAVGELGRLMAEAQDEQARVAALRRQADQEVDWAVTAVHRARQALGWQILPSREGIQLAKLQERLEELPADLEDRIATARSITAAAQRIEARIVNRRRRGGVWIVGGGMGTGWGGGGGGGGGGGFGGGGFGGGSFGGGGFGGGSFGGGGFGGGGGSSGSW